MTKQTVFVILNLILLISCTPAISPTPTPNPTAKPPSTLTPSKLTPSPIITVVSPTATSTLSPSSTPTPSPQPAETETPAPTETEIMPETPTPSVARFSVGESIEVFGESPAVTNDTIGPSGTQFTDPGGVIFHDGQFHMFHNGFTGWPAEVDVMYSISDDGLEWRMAQDQPVFTGNDLPYVGVAALASSVAILDDGRWALYFYTWDDPTWPKSGGSIGVATAPGPAGPWTALAEPILSPGPSGAWDDLAVRTPSVVQTEDGYLMFFAGSQEGTAAIGRAFSSDGITWAKYDDPATEGPYAESDPVFVGSGSGWDAVNVYQPRVRLTEEGWVMLYTSANQIDGNTLFQNHGLAVSGDGVEWIRSDKELFTASEASPRGRNIWFTELVYAQDRYFYYFELGNGSETEIYVARFGSDLFSD